ncbi:MAG TPA: CPBP family intramembrane glutamic endopeptidase [Acidimicrobiia bacterium]|nr:CPBP family intramembrane glutamic endopeptidase [Acidimicrobiia bacterium]
MSGREVKPIESQESRQRAGPPNAGPLWAHALAVVFGLFLIGLFTGLAYAIAAAAVGVGLFLFLSVKGGGRNLLFRRAVDVPDLLVMLALYGAVIAFYRLAFVVVKENDLLLFLFFAIGLLVGVVGAVVYTVWARKRPLESLGLSLSSLPRVALLALLFAAVQFSITLWGYDLPETQGWVTLLGMALMVGLFESIFFRGFVQERLQASLGSAPAVFGAALLYGVYHVGYGMGLEEVIFLSGLGVVYGLAYLAARNILVLWPLLTPLGSLFAQLEGGELVGRLPWAALFGFADVMAVMATAIWLAHRHLRKRERNSRSPAVNRRTASTSLIQRPLG